jgi:hypothetical protein
MGRFVEGERTLQFCQHLYEERLHMDIRFVSSLTADDEDQLAPALLKAIGSLLDQFPIAYTMRIETISARVYHHAHPSFAEAAGTGPISLGPTRRRQKLMPDYDSARKNFAP